MARIEELLGNVADAELRAKLEAEVAGLKGSKDFGLVFERHEPESVLLPSSTGIVIGDKVRLRKDMNNKRTLTVAKLTPKKVIVEQEDGSQESHLRTDILVARGFSDSVFPTLSSLGAVRRSKVRPSHLVIESDNYHALELLTLTHEHQVDVIYIDPPYNTGAKDWRYNNDYVDDSDTWRHSRWLSFIEKRLVLAKRLLKPNGVLVVTIDEHEGANLGVLLAEKHLFGDARRQMVTIVNNAAGVSQGGFFRVEEYAYFCFLGDSKPTEVPDDLLSNEGKKPGASPWFSLIRFGGINSTPSKRPGLVYPVEIDPENLRIASTGPTVKDRVDSGEIKGDPNKWRPNQDEITEGNPIVWPYRGDGSLSTWQLKPETLLDLQAEGFVRVKPHPSGTGGNEYSVSYIKSGNRSKVLTGEIPTGGREGGDGPYILAEVERSVIPKTVWHRARHDAGKWGSRSLRELLGSVAFDYAKSPYAVLDTLRTLLNDRPDAVIVDFFAGSGTTLQSTTMLNAEDGGKRRSILVTNNEVDERVAKRLAGEGLFPGDKEYEAKGIFEGVTRPRSEAVVTGKKPDGTDAEGTYLDGREVSDGCEENVEFLRLDYLDPNAIELGLAYEELHPLLWLMAGGKGERPEVIGIDGDDNFTVVEDSGYAVLFDEKALSDFIAEIADKPEIRHVFLQTVSEDSYGEMSSALPDRTTHMWPRDYLRFFRDAPGRRS